ncbi:hypothetical protein SGRA_2965 [Saprospira grandis str. Lewin]|uniref:Uncharacterized protein n=1 Tax=Saprospira grandis (strain Lewin) TaxID=984262 RepID=H6LAV0_SAPGL|nr:hypothetical protein SGRA_2965 [Saprospira grandis str. Lewin]
MLALSAPSLDLNIIFFLLFLLGPAASSAFGLSWPPLCCAARRSARPCVFFATLKKLGLAFGHGCAALGLHNLSFFSGLFSSAQKFPFQLAAFN